MASKFPRFPPSPLTFPEIAMRVLPIKETIMAKIINLFVFSLNIRYEIMGTNMGFVVTRTVELRTVVYLREVIHRIKWIASMAPRGIKLKISGFFSIFTFFFLKIKKMGVRIKALRLILYVARTIGGAWQSLIIIEAIPTDAIPTMRIRKALSFIINYIRKDDI